jgi:hypothetical protein
MKINPTSQTITEIAAMMRPTAKPASAAAASPVWGQDACVPALDESPYLNYNRLGETTNVPQETAGMSIMSNKSIYDFSYTQLKALMEQALQACDALNTTGMTKGQIYNSIEAIFIQHFGKDFWEPHIIGMQIPISQSDPMRELLESGKAETPMYAFARFETELRKHGIDGPYDSGVVIEARYSGMTDIEIRTAIRSQYPEEMTLRQCMVMEQELSAVGLEKVRFNVFTEIFASIVGIDKSLPTAGQEIRMANLFMALLEMPADYETYMMNINNHFARTAGCTRKWDEPPARDSEHLEEKLFSMFSKKDQYTLWWELAGQNRQYLADGTNDLEDEWLSTLERKEQYSELLKKLDNFKTAMRELLDEGFVLNIL